MREIIYVAAIEGAAVYYSNTDRLGVKRDLLNSMGLIGSTLGRFKLEHEFVKFIGLSPRKFCRVYADGRVESQGLQLMKNKPADELGYFERHY